MNFALNWDFKRTIKVSLMHKEIEKVALLEAIRKVQTDFLIDKTSNEVFDTLLSEILAITGSEYGFIGDILYSEDSQPYLKTRAITNIAWNQETEQFYAENAPKGLEFTNLDTLFGHVIKTGKAILTNNPINDKRAGGTPHGHPPLNSFLGMPIYLSNQFIGMVGIANRKGGYEEGLTEYLQPLLATCAHIIQAFNIKQQWKSADHQLKSRNALDRAIFDNIVDGIITINDKGIILSVNPAITTIFGFVPSEMVGKNISMLMPGPHHSHHDDYITNYLKTGEAKILGIGREVEALHKEGYLIPIDLTINEMTIDNEHMFVGILRDISERKTAERKLQQTMSIQKAILDSANFTIISTTTRGIIKSFNSGAARMLGYAPEEVIDKVTPEIIHVKEEVIERASSLSEELGVKIEPGFEVFVAKARLGIPDENEWTYIRKDGSTFPVMLSVTALYDENNNISGYLGIGSDITERKKVEKTKNEFVSSVSHELRTPLTSIGGALGLILGGVTGEIDDKTKKMLEIANTNCDRLVRLINDILDIEKIEFGKMSFKKIYTNVNQVIERALNDNEQYASSFNVDLYFEKNTPDNLSILLDQDRILQVLTNLLSNAIKYSPPGDTVTVRSKVDDVNVHIEVSDNGEGIPAEFHSEIFKKFSQADSSSTRKKGGTGLGLNIAKAIIEKHDGELGFETKVNHGSTFYFSLPLKPKNKPISRDYKSIKVDEEKITHVKSSHPKILHVEDDGDIAEIINTMVSGTGEVTHCNTIEKAKKILEKERFELVIIDVGLPDGSGLDLIPLIKSKHGSSIVILSAYELKPGIEKVVDSILVKSQNSNDRIKRTIDFFIHGKEDAQDKDKFQ
jgi:PAS domain S-box-containing protein